VKCWRPRTAGGKWKWLIFDLDYGFHGGHLGPEANVFQEMHSQDNGTTLLFFKLLENETFRHAFINRACDHLNVTFDTTRVIQRIRDFQAGKVAISGIRRRSPATLRMVRRLPRFLRSMPWRGQLWSLMK
jgi:hypothetical protein